MNMVFYLISYGHYMQFILYLFLWLLRLGLSCAIHVLHFLILSPRILFNDG